MRMLSESDENHGTLDNSIFVSQKSGNYYYYEVYSSNGTLLIELIDESVTTYELSYKSETQANTMQYRASYNKFIVAQERTSNDTVSYWVLTITKTQTGYQLQSFAVSSIIDDEDYLFEDFYRITKVIEYNEIDQFLYVQVNATTDYDVYGIDLAKKSQRLITIGWFYYPDKGEIKIVGGNSRVLVEGLTDQFWFDTRNKRLNNSDPTIYDMVNASTFTTLPIYPSGDQAYSFFSSYFQYVSLSSDGLNMTTFIYKGYTQTKTTYAEGSINSTSKPIKIFSDEQTYFLAIGDNDVYVSGVEWNDSISDYQITSTTLDKFESDETKRQQLLTIFSSIIFIVFRQGTLFMLSTDTFYAYSLAQLYQKPLDNPVSADNDLEDVVLAQMKAFYSTNS